MFIFNQVLRQKEKGDWKKLSKHEKKALYRFSFCQTFEEFGAPTGEWKLCLAGGFIAGALALWYMMWMKKYSKFFSQYSRLINASPLQFNGFILKKSCKFFNFSIRIVLPPLPESVSEESRKAQLKRALDLGIGHVDGLSSKWDYENKRWK